MAEIFRFFVASLFHWLIKNNLLKIVEEAKFIELANDQ